MFEVLLWFLGGFSLVWSAPSSFYTRDQDWIEFCLNSNTADCAANLVKKCSLEGEICVPSTANIMQVPESLAPIAYKKYGTHWTQYCNNQESPEACKATKKCETRGGLCMPSWTAVKANRFKQDSSQEGYCNSQQDAAACNATKKCEMDGEVCVPAYEMVQKPIKPEIGLMNISPETEKPVKPEMEMGFMNNSLGMPMKQETGATGSPQEKPAPQESRASEMQQDDNMATWAQYCIKQENATTCHATHKCEMRGGTCIPFFNAIEWPNYCKQQVTEILCNATKKCIMRSNSCVPFVPQNISTENADINSRSDLEWTLYCNKQDNSQVCSATNKCEMQGDACVPLWKLNVLKQGDLSKCLGCLARGLAFCQTDNRCQTPYEHGCKSPKDHVASSQEEVDWTLKKFGHLVTFPCPGSKVPAQREPDPDSWN